MMSTSTFKSILLFVFCFILPERFDSTPRNFATLKGARRFLTSAGTAFIVGWQVGNPMLVNAYGPTDVEIKINRFETASSLLSAN